MRRIQGNPCPSFPACFRPISPSFPMFSQRHCERAGLHTSDSPGLFELRLEHSYSLRAHRVLALRPRETRSLRADEAMPFAVPPPSRPSDATLDFAGFRCIWFPMPVWRSYHLARPANQAVTLAATAQSAVVCLGFQTTCLMSFVHAHQGVLPCQRPPLNAPRN